MLDQVKCIFFFDDSRNNQKRLFEEAISSAKNGKVLYILREELNELPELSQDFSSINRQYMKMISFLYVKSLETLLESLSSLPNWQNIPGTIIIEDLNEYCGNNIQNACGIVALLLDSARSCSTALNCQTKLCVSVTKGAFSDEYCDTLKELYSAD